MVAAAPANHSPDRLIGQTSRLDGHHDLIRFTWSYEGTKDGQEVVVDGADTIILSPGGRLARIMVFDGATPQPLSEG